MPIMIIISFIISFAACWIIIKTSRWHISLSADNDFKGLQKFHRSITPRIGGLAVVSSAWILALYGILSGNLWAKFFIKILAPTSIVFLVGFSEDLIKRLSPLTRLGLVILACIIGVYLIHVINRITHTEVVLLDYILRFEPISLVLTIFIILGVTNAFNIIDGYNGLCITTFILICFTCLLIAFEINYHFLDMTIYILLGAACGFALWNYPVGRIFLGDGGAYLLGFSGTLILLELSQKVDNYSPFTSFLIMIYPITETILSIYRKKILRKRSPFKPDRLHMHMVVYYRLIQHDIQNKNAAVLIKMLWFILPQLLIAVIFYNQQLVIIASIIIYISVYFWLYFRIIRFKIPKLLKLNLKSA